MIDLAIDGLRVAHMASFAIGIGAAAFLEVQVVKRFRKGVDIEGLRLLLHGHDLIRGAVIGLWLTGLALLYVRLVVLCDPFTAKLGAKLAIVTLLSVNMFVIDRVLIPEIFIYEDTQLNEIPPATLMEFGAIAGFSAGCWLSALLLGGIGRFKTMDVWELASVLVPLLAAATVAGIFAAMLASRTGERPPAAGIVPAE